MLHSDVQRITVHCIDTIKFVKTDTCVQSEKRLDSNGGVFVTCSDVFVYTLLFQCISYEEECS